MTEPERNGAGAQSERSVAQRLGRFVEVEARRAVAETEIEPDPARIAAGWTRRFIAEEHRAEEAVQLYRELGFEACADPVRQQDVKGECEDCKLMMLLRFRMVYTRRRPPG
jgi:hypothetical protein